MQLNCREEEDPPPSVSKLLFNPKTRRAIDPADVDGLIDGLEIVKKSIGMMMHHKEVIEDAIIEHAKDIKTKTRHVQGERRKADVIMPDDKQNSAALKKIAQSKKFRLIWKQLVKVSGYSVKMREYNIAKNTKGTEEWNEYRDTVKAAISLPTARPRVTIKE